MPPLRKLARSLPLLLLAAAAPFQGPMLTGGWRSGGPPLYQVNAVATDPSQEAVVYAAASIYSASQSALFRSPDGGKTWEPLVESLTGDFYSAVLVDPRTPQRIYAGAQGSSGAGILYRSTDTGVSWNQTGSVSPSCSPSFALGSGGDTVLCACGTAFLRSMDGGASWTTLMAPFQDATHLAAASGGILAYGVSKVYRSANDGVSWTVIASAPAACPGILALRQDPNDANVLVAGAGSVAGGSVCGGVFRSEDGGQSWGANALSGYYVTDVALDPRDPSRIFAAASSLGGILPQGGVFVSRDSGASFSSLRLPTSGALRLAISSGGRFLHAATPDGVFDVGFRRTTSVERGD